MRYIIGLFLIMCINLSATADESGVPFWLSGQYSCFYAVSQKPGLYLPILYYGYNAKAEGSKEYQRGSATVVGLQTQVALPNIFPTFVPKFKILGGTPLFGIGIGYGYNNVNIDLAHSRIDSSSHQYNSYDEVWGFGDLYPTFSLSWNRGLNNFMTYLSGDVPVGKYSSDRLATVGIGHGSLDIGGAYTFLNDSTGLEFGAMVGLTYNFENPSTNYKSGIDSHLDWDITHFLNNHLQVGISGYVYYQLTDDSGEGDMLGSFKSNIASVGPQVGYLFYIHKQEWYINVSGYWEFWAENRVKGNTVLATINIPIKVFK